MRKYGMFAVFILTVFVSMLFLSGIAKGNDGSEGIIKNPYGGCINNNPEPGQHDMFCYRNVSFGWVEWGKYFTGCAPNSVVIIPVKRDENSYELYAVTNKEFFKKVKGDRVEWIFYGATEASNDADYDDLVNGQILPVRVVHRMKCEEGVDLGIDCGNGYSVWQIGYSEGGNTQYSWQKNDLERLKIRFFSCGARVDGDSSDAYNYSKLKMCNMWWGRLEDSDRVNDVCKNADDKGKCICENHYRMACKTCYIFDGSNLDEKTKCNDKNDKKELYQCLYDNSGSITTLSDNQLGFPQDHIDCNGKCEFEGGNGGGGGNTGNGGNGGGNGQGGEQQCTTPFHPPIVNRFRLDKIDDSTAMLNVNVEHSGKWGCDDNGEGERKAMIEIYSGDDEIKIKQIQLNKKQQITIDGFNFHKGMYFRIRLMNKNREQRITNKFTILSPRFVKYVDDYVFANNNVVRIRIQGKPQHTDKIMVYLIAEKHENEISQVCDDNIKEDCYLDFGNDTNEVSTTVGYKVKGAVFYFITRKSIYRDATRIVRPDKYRCNGCKDITGKFSSINEQDKNRVYAKYVWGTWKDVHVKCNGNPAVFTAYLFDGEYSALYSIIRTDKIGTLDGGAIIIVPENGCKIYGKELSGSQNTVKFGLSGIHLIPPENDEDVKTTMQSCNATHYCYAIVNNSGEFELIPNGNGNSCNKDHYCILSKWLRNKDGECVWDYSNNYEGKLNSCLVTLERKQQNGQGNNGGMLA